MSLLTAVPAGGGSSPLAGPPAAVATTALADGAPAGSAVLRDDPARAQRALELLYAGRRALANATGEQALANDFCRLVVEQAGYRGARICHRRDAPGRGLEVVAGAAAPATGGASGLALALAHDGEPFGALEVHAAAAEVFDDAELRLLDQIARDYAFGVALLRAKAQAEVGARLGRRHRELLNRSLAQSIEAIAATVEARDPYTAGHEKRVADLATAIGRELGLPADRVHGLHLAATVHDVGKVRVPAEILSRPRLLSDTEFALVRTHPESGYDILKDMDFPWPIAAMVLQHHERADGSGYPRGLKGGQILLEARILAVADVVEAMSSHRPYRPSLGLAQALAEIEGGRGTCYDADVVDACLRLFREQRFAFAEH